MRRSHLPPEHWMQHVTCPSAIQSARPPGGYLPVHLACRCEAIANDSAADDMMQIINPLGLERGTATARRGCGISSYFFPANP